MRNEESIQKSTNQISTGSRIEQPSDDPIGTSQAMGYRTKLTKIKQYIENAQLGISWINSSDDALMTLDSDIQRVNELVVKGANDTLDPKALNALAEEVDEIRDAIMQLANSSLDSRYVFAGDRYLSPAYQTRMVVSGNNLNLNAKKIVLNSQNSQIRVKLDNSQIVTLDLTPKTYDGSPGNTLDDLAKDIEKKLQAKGFDVPVHAKLNPDNQLVFYAGETPPDGAHILVLKEGPAIKSTGKVGWPYVNNQLGLDSAPEACTNTADDFYNGWKVTITSGKGAGQTRTVMDYNGTTAPAQTITALDQNWDIVPDRTSEYQLTPPLEGSPTGIGGGGTQLMMDPAAYSRVNNFYNGMTIAVTNSAGQTETRTITGYNAGAPPTLTLDTALTITDAVSYTITPHLGGNAQAGAADPDGIVLDAAAGASNFDDFYAGASITVTYADGITETKKILSYDGTTHTAQVDGNWRYDINTSAMPVKYKISDTALSQLGFFDKANTKEITGSVLEDKTLIMGAYPFVGTAQGSATVNDITLGTIDAAQAGYYNNWTITITDGPGADPNTPRTLSLGTTDTYTVTPPWPAGGQPTSLSKYTLSPPLVGTTVQLPAVANNQIRLSNPLTPTMSAMTDFYKGMKITITSGTGVEQERQILAYDPLTQIATVDQDWGIPPDNTSTFSVDADYYQNANNKITIKVGVETPQEISLDGGYYSPEELARMVENKIRARGGKYDNIRVNVTSDNRLQIVPVDPDLNNLDEPLSIELTSGSTADALGLIGFTNGMKSETGVPNFEGNKAAIDYEVNLGVSIKINIEGDKIFDPIFKHLTQISLDLRNGDTKALSGQDLSDIQDDLDRVLVAQGQIGAKANRLEKTVNRFNSLDENVTGLLSKVEDTDISQAIIDLRMRETAYQAALQAGAKVLQMTLLDYLR